MPLNPFRACELIDLLTANAEEARRLNFAYSNPDFQYYKGTPEGDLFWKNRTDERDRQLLELLVPYREWLSELELMVSDLMDAAEQPSVRDGLDLSAFPDVINLFRSGMSIPLPQDYFFILKAFKIQLDRLDRRLRNSGNMHLKDESAKSGVDDLVDLDEAAAIVHRSKKTLERAKTTGKLPPPHVEGGGGKPSLWKWEILRPWLEKEYVPDLPKRFPRNIR